MNTYYASLSARQQEMAALQTVGYRPWMIAFSMLQEGVLLSIIGTCLSLAICVLGFDGFAIAFSSGTFTLDFNQDILMLGLCCGIGLGVIGTLLPAWRCLRTPLTVALRTTT